MVVLGISGSLRRASFNRGLIRAAAELAPAGMAIEPVEIREIPLYDADLEALGDPAPVAALKARIVEADGLLIACPENSWSIPGVLKNTLDWVSRPPQRALTGKPIAIVGASPGGFGTARGQLALRQSLQWSESPVLPAPHLYVSRAGDKFDADGNLVDADTRESLRGVVEAFARWLEQLRAGTPG